MIRKISFIYLTIILTLVLIPLVSAVGGQEDTIKWNKNFSGNGGGTSSIQAIGFDNQSGVFFAGYGEDLYNSTSNADWWIKRFWLNGSEDFTWNRTFHSRHSFDDKINALGFDNQSGVFFAGFGTYLVSASSSYDWWIKRFWLNGSEDFTWNKSLNGGAVSADDRINALGFDNNSGIFFAGHGYNTFNSTSLYDWWIKRFWLNGSEDFTWNRTFNGRDAGIDQINALGFDGNSGVFFVGSGQNLASASSDYDWWIKRFWLNGSEDRTWNKNITGTATGVDYLNDVGFDGSGNVFFAGYGNDLINSGTNYDWWIKKFLLNGTEDLTWNKTFNGAMIGSPDDFLYSLGFDNNSGVFFAGYGAYLFPGFSNYDWWIKRFWLNGSEDRAWNKTFNSFTLGQDSLYVVGFDGFGNVYAAGDAWGNISGIGNSWWIKRYELNTDGIACYFVANATCPATTVKLIGLKNDTGGYTNSHAEISSLSNYNNSICCNGTSPSIIIGNNCDETTVIRLNQTTNSHVEIGTLSNYANLACLNSTYKKVSCIYTQSGYCPTNYKCILSMANSEGNDTTNAHLDSCYQDRYLETACCGTFNVAPSKPVLTLPINGNATVFERYINFSWVASTDPEGDAITYNLNATCGSCTCSNIYQTGITGINHTMPNALCKDVIYNWTVTACDSYGDCNVSAQSNFTILSVLDFILISNATSFGSMTQNQNDDTSDNSPSPIVGRNLGNVLINASINATPLFSSVGLNTNAFMFKSANNESGSINVTCSQLTYTNFTNPYKNFFCNLSYVDTSDEVKLDINVTVPATEPAGFKSSIIEINAVSAE